jgi:hypothetical protein
MNPEDLSIEELQELLRSKIEESEIEEPSETVIDDDFTVTRTDSVNEANKQKVEAKDNTWIDEGEHKDVETPEYKPTTRNRLKPESHKVNRVCHICGKKFEISPSLISGEFTRCDNCTGRK